MWGNYNWFIKSSYKEALEKAISYNNESQSENKNVQKTKKTA